MRQEEFEYMLALLALASVLRACCEISRPKAKADTRSISGTAKSTLAIPQQKEWSDLAIKKYAEAQDKKWRRWKEAMFE